MELLQVVPSCVASLEDVAEADHKDYVTVKIRKKWNSKMFDLPDEPFTRQFYFVHSVGQFKGKTSREIIARDRSVPNLTESSLDETGKPRVALAQNQPDQSRSQIAGTGNKDRPERPGLKQTAPGNRQMLRRHTVNDAVASKRPETAANLPTPQEASISQS